jgi:hypothetical protein
MSARLVVAVIAAALAACGPTATTGDAGGDASVPDVNAGDGPGEAPDTCADGAKDGTETDVDCGGGCAPCADGLACVLATDCASSRCSAGTCGLRAWSVESNGTNVSIPGDQTWVDGSFSGLLITPTLYAPSLVFLRWTGTLRFAGGGNGLCAVGQRFVVDDVPTGNPTWGNAIMIEDGATRWHETFTTESAVPLGLGIHKIAVEMTNGTNYGSCYLDGDGGLPYDRSRLAVAAYDPKSAWYVESTGQASSIGSSTFVDIPGVSVTFALAADRHVQTSLTGTQLVQGVTPNVGQGYCAYRLVVDGTPLGDATYGQALTIGDAATGWWAPVALKYGQDLAAGTHTISAQMSNTSTLATCYADYGDNAYARFRMFVSSAPTGGPNVSVESTGGPNVLGSLSAWTDIGLGTSFTVSAPTPAQLEMAATERTLSGSGHCAWRFLIDGSPLGDVDHGQAINVGSAATWWTATSLLWGQTFDAGNHTVSVQVRNSSNSGDCGTNADTAPYGRARLFVRVP